MKTDKKIVYYAGCAAKYNDTEIGVATVQILQKNGFSPVFPDQKCCAIPQLIYGNLRSFLKYAEFNVRSLAEADCDIVTACPSCALAIKLEYPKLLRSREAKMVAQRTYDIMEYLAMLKDRNALNTEFHAITSKVVYHAPCHLKVLGQEVIQDRLKLLKLIPGISVERIDRGCCGMGGTFGLKQANYSSSMTIGQALFEGIKELAPDIVATDCPACKMQIEQGTVLMVTHPILIVKQAYMDSLPQMETAKG